MDRNQAAEFFEPAEDVQALWQALEQSSEQGVTATPGTESTLLPGDIGVRMWSATNHVSVTGVHFTHAGVAMAAR